MSEVWMIVEWDLPWLRVLLVERQAGGVRLRAARAVELPAGLGESGSGIEISQWLKLEQSDLMSQFAAGDGLRQVAVVLPKDRVAIRALDVPAMSAAELPAIIPLQMAAQLATRPEDIAVDFLPSPPALAADGRRVLVTAVPLPTLTQIRQFAAALNATLSYVGISSGALTELLTRLNGISLTGSTILCCCARHRIEAIHLSDSDLLASSYRRRSSQESVTSREAVAEIRRLLMQSNENHFDPPQRILLFDESRDSQADLAELAREMSVALNQTVEPISADSAIGQQLADTEAGSLTLAACCEQGLGAPLGAIWGAVGPTVAQVNLQAPREAILAPDRSKLKLGIGVAAGLLVLVGAWWMWRQQILQLEDEVKMINTQMIGNRDVIKRQGPVLKQTATLSLYEQRSLAANDHWSEILNDLPPRDQLLLTTWRAIPLSGATHTRVIANGIAQKRQLAERLAEKLAERGYVVRSPVIRPLEGKPPFAFEFDLDYEIPEKRPVPAAAASAKQASSPARPPSPPKT